MRIAKISALKSIIAKPTQVKPKPVWIITQDDVLILENESNYNKR